MSNLSPLDPESAPAAARPALEKLRQPSGRVLNFYGTLAHAPAALDGFLALKASLANGALAPELRERVAVAVAQENGCAYCLSAHVGALRRLGVPDPEVDAARRGTSEDARARAALELSRTLLRAGNGVPADALEAARAGGLTPEEALEVAAHVALNVFSNAVNLLADTDVDLPRVSLELPPSE